MFYTYDTDGFLVGQTEGQIDPLETKKAGLEVRLQPAKSTTKAPPVTGANEAAKFNGTKWTKVPDYSGIDYYKKSDQSLKRFEKGESLGTSHTTTKPSSLNETWSGSAWVITASKQTEIDKNTELSRCMNESNPLGLKYLYEQRLIDRNDPKKKTQSEVDIFETDWIDKVKEIKG